MPETTYEYAAQRFAPREGTGQQMLLFVAPAADIRAWAGVPRKAFDYQHGFQRTLNPGRVNEVARFFRESDRNVSPTSVVVAFTGAVEIVADGPADAPVQTVTVRITVPDFASMPIDELTGVAMEHLRQRIPEEAAQVDADAGEAIARAVRLQDEEAVDEAFGIEPGSDEDAGAGLDASAREQSYLADFYAQLLGYRTRAVAWPEEGPLREILYSLLRPAIIVDGQHRVFGGASAEANMRFAVCALPSSSWAESVYQFVVINQKAKPIKPAFLSSIIATSLNDAEIAEVYDRLRASNVDVARAEIMERVNSDPTSPFHELIDFEVQGSPGFLQFPGMAKLIRDFLQLPRSRPVLLPNDAWENVEGEPIQQFFALWWGVRDHFEAADPRLWRRPSQDNPNRLLMIVTLQEMQGVMLDSWADSRAFRLGDLADMRARAKQFWEDFPTTFFTDEWRQKGLQTSTGRNILRSAMLETRRNQGRSNWGHRRLKLFSE